MLIFIIFYHIIISFDIIFYNIMLILLDVVFDTHLTFQTAANQILLNSLRDIFELIFSAAKLQSALENLEGILGDNCHQPTAVDALMKFNYDVEKALDEILSKGALDISHFDFQTIYGMYHDFWAERLKTSFRCYDSKKN